MTHYKNDWFIKGAKRLANGQRFIIGNNILASFLIYCIKSEIIGYDFKITVCKSVTKTILVP